MKKNMLLIMFLSGLINGQAEIDPNNHLSENNNMKKRETAVFGAGCFWCVEAVFQTLKGVYAVEPGYTGGSTKNPTYYDVITGTTGHAEVARITFDPDEVSFEFLLSVFFQTHDPTALNYQGADIGTQYRSAVFYTSDEQKLKAEKIISKLDDAQAYPNKIVTEVSALKIFYLAEDYHKNYFITNPDQAYCKFVIQPKMEKFKKVFKDYLK